MLETVYFVARLLIEWMRAVIMFQLSTMVNWLVVYVQRELFPDFAFHVYGVRRFSVLSVLMSHPAREKGSVSDEVR